MKAPTPPWKHTARRLIDGLRGVVFSVAGLVVGTVMIPTLIVVAPAVLAVVVLDHTLTRKLNLPLRPPSGVYWEL